MATKNSPDKSHHIGWFYVTRETVSNNYCQIVTRKQNKTMKLEWINTAYSRDEENQSVERLAAGGCGFDSRGRTISQGLKMTEKWRYCLRDGPLEKLWGGGFSSRRNFFRYQIPSLRADENKLWLTPSTNQSLVIVCTQAIKFLVWIFLGHSMNIC